MCNIQFLNNLPIDIHDKISNLTYTSMRNTQIYSKLKLYVKKYGLQNGPFLNLPFHPEYPFATIIRLNPKHYMPRFSKKAYLLLWYLVDVYTIGMIIDSVTILRYLEFCTLNHPIKDNKSTHLRKWLKLFGPESWWQNRLANHQTVFVIFQRAAKICTSEDGTRTIMRTYECDVQEYNDEKLDGFKSLICEANGMKLSDLPENLISCNWENPNSYPEDFVREIIDCVEEFEYWDRWSRDQPPKYIPGFKIYDRFYSLECSEEEEE